MLCGAGQSFAGQTAENDLDIYGNEGSLLSATEVRIGVYVNSFNCKLWAERADIRVLVASGEGGEYRVFDMDPRLVLVVSKGCRIARRRAATLRRLHRRLLEECIRVERARMLHMRHYQTVQALPLPGLARLAPWMFLSFFGTDENFINLTGLCRRSFNRLLTRSSLFYDIPVHRPRRGRPRKLQHHHQVLGLLLAFYVVSMGQKGLCSKFGVPPATLCRVLNEAELAMNRALAGFSPARIVWPSIARQRALSRLTADRHPLLPFTWGFIDGKNLRVQKPSARDLQNAHYNGWLHAVFVTGTLCFSADGLIVWSKHNYPGSWNDADTSFDFRMRLLYMNLNPDTRYGVIADSASPCGDDMLGRIMTPLKEGDLARLVPSVRAVAHRKSKAITFIRQSIEWGMGSVEKVFHRLAFPLPYDVQKRRIRLDNLFRLANYRVRTVEISDIRTTFVYGRVDNQ